MSPTSQMRRVGSLLALAMLCVITIFGLTHCKIVPDTLVGPDRGRSTPAGTCVGQCVDQYRDSLEAEQDLHKENLRECRAGRDDDDDDSVADGSDLLKGGDGNKNKKRNKWRTCIREENERHEAAVQRILEGRQQCIAGCHHQGGGSGR